MCSDAPDTSGMNAAAVQAQDISADALAWYKAKDAAQQPMLQAAANKAMEVSDAQLASMKQNDALSKDYADYSKATFRPLEQGIVADSQAYDTPERRQAAADSAMGDVNKAFAASNEARARTMAANGIDPASTRAMSVMEGQGVDQAVANASAAYNARKGVETVGYARKMDAASLGRNLASNQATSAQVALTAGNASVNSAGAPIAQANQTTATTGAGFGTALNGQQIAGNLYGKAAEMQSQDQGLWGAVGQLGGAAISKYSDENLKTDIAPMSDEEALAATDATDVKKWKYDPAKMAAQGIQMGAEDQGEQVGPMAQDVQANMGEGASDGHKLNMVTMNGINMKAVQAVNKKVDKLTAEVTRIAAMIGGGQLQAGARQ